MCSLNCLFSTQNKKNADTLGVISAYKINARSNVSHVVLIRIKLVNLMLV